MKEVRTKHFVVRDSNEDLKCYKVLKEGVEIGSFTSIEMEKAVNVIYVNIPAECMKEVFSAYQRELNKPMLFLDNKALSYAHTEVLKMMGATYEESSEDAVWKNQRAFRIPVRVSEEGT